MVLGPTEPLKEMSARNISLEQRRPVCKDDNHTTFMRRLSRNVEASASWNPQASGIVLPFRYVLK